MAAARPSLAVIRNAVKAWQDCGLIVGGMVIDQKAGTVRILAPDEASAQSAPKPGANSCDSLFGDSD